MVSSTTTRQDIHGHYLSLALEARRIIDELMHVAKSWEESSDRQKTLKAVIASLEMTAPVRPAAQSRSVFSHYEQIRTFDEVKNPEERAALTEELKKLLSNRSGLKESKNSLYDTIDFFADVESRALYHYRRRPVTLPTDGSGMVCVLVYFGYGIQ